MLEKHLLKLPFDQYQRYKLIQEIVNHLRWEQPLTVLDVGGAPGILRSFLPDDHVLIADLSDQQGAHLLADGKRMPFSQDSFDVVVSTDTLEHIPLPDRIAFIQEIIRLSDKLLILAGPFKDPKVDRAEELLQSIIWSRFGEGNPFLEEHRQHGLPELEGTCRIINQNNLPYVTLPNGYLHHWIIGIATYFLLQWQFHDPSVTECANAYYNENFYRSDNREPSYRKVIVASNLLPLDGLRRTLCVEPDARVEDEAIHLHTLNILVEGIAEKWSRKAIELRATLDKERQSSEAYFAPERSRLNAIIDDLHAQLQQSTENIHSLQIEQSELKKTLQLQSEQNQELRQKNSQQQREATQARKALQELKEELQQVNELITRRTQELDHVRRSHTQLETQHSLLRKSRIFNLTRKLWSRWHYTRLTLKRRLGWLKPIPLFDSDWYLRQYPDVARSGVDPYVHYCVWGWREGRNPGPLFDVTWYLQTNPDVLREGLEPLGHYLRHGRWENRRPHPNVPIQPYPIPQPEQPTKEVTPIASQPGSAAIDLSLRDCLRLWRAGIAIRTGRLKPPPIFDSFWYRQQWLDVDSSGLDPYLHYRLWGWRQGRNPHPCFSVSHYLNFYPDVLAAGVEPFEHFLTYGWLEGRNPSPEIDTYGYLSQHVGEPRVGLLSLISMTSQEAIGTAKFDSLALQKDIIRRIEIEQAFKKRTELPTYEAQEIVDLKQPPIKLIAFYLPQFHPIPENDVAWGPGFTEWVNVVKAQPLFEGHYQPRLPGDLGYYDLRLVEVMQQQAQLAKQHGIHGFCFHYYWFNGHRVLERPVEQFLEHPEINISFCLNWANENWTRRWDGAEDEVLLRQDHTPEDDLAFIQDAIRHFKDPRYIHIDNRPLLLLYNPQKLPDPEGTAARWRESTRQAGFEDLFLTAVQSFGFEDPTTIGFDAAVEFPPHNAFTLKVISDQQTFYSDFEGFVIDYHQLPEIYAPREKHYTLFKGIIPSWDNTARRGKSAAVYHGSTPNAYKAWLKTALRATTRHNEPQHQYIFINAWNEWAESAYLEPDRKYGYAYLNATSIALKDIEVDKPTILFVSHDAYRAGAQMLLLDLIQWIKDHTNYEFRIILGRGGALQAQYETLGPTLVLDEIINESERKVEQAIQSFCDDQVQLIYLNSAASGWILPYLDAIDAPVLTHVHELQRSIDKFVGSENFELVRERTDHFIAVSPPVQDNLIKTHRVDPKNIDLVHAFIKKRTDPDKDRASLCVDLGLDMGIPIVFGCGAMHWRKGPDLFLDVAVELRNRGDKAFHFIWLGARTYEFPNPQEELVSRNLQDYVTFMGEVDNARSYFAAGDLFLLPSREDPFPLVALEAAECGLPIVCFADSGGIPEVISESRQTIGKVVSFENVQAMADAIEDLLDDKDLRQEMGTRARNWVLDHHTQDRAMPFILETIRKVGGFKPGVSVIVPAYNHARFIHQRLDSILNQTYQDMELILLDDASTDETGSIFRQYEKHPCVHVVINDTNSGSTFAQWAKGIQHAQADILWIAEDDDFCEPTFLETLLPYFQDPSVRLAYCQSYAVDAEDQVLFSYADDSDPTIHPHWKTSYVMDAPQEAALTLAVKNTIPNASAVLFRRFDIKTWETEWTKTNLAGDWAFYMYAIRTGKIAFHAEHLNYHRRHEDTNIRRTQFSPQRFVETVRAQNLALRLFHLPRSTIDRMRANAFEIWHSVFTGRPKSEFDPTYDALLRGIPTASDLLEALPAEPQTQHISRDRYAICNTKIEKVILPGKDAIYVGIPGTGSTYMKQFLSETFGWKIDNSVHFPGSEIYQHTIFADMNSEEFSGYFKFAFVRNPFSRIYSVYKNKRYPTSAYRNVIDGIEAGLHAMGFRKEHTFSQFIELVCTTPDCDADPSVIAQTSLLYSDHDQLTVDKLYRYEAFKASLVDLEQKLSLSMDLGTLPWVYRLQEDSDEYQQHYNENMIEAVVQRYARDFELLGYAKTLR